MSVLTHNLVPHHSCRDCTGLMCTDRNTQRSHSSLLYVMFCFFLLPVRWHPLHPDWRTFWTVLPTRCLHDRWHRELALQLCRGPPFPIHSSKIWNCTVCLGETLKDSLLLTVKHVWPVSSLLGWASSPSFDATTAMFHHSNTINAHLQYCHDKMFHHHVKSYFENIPWLNIKHDLHFA